MKLTINLTSKEATATIDSICTSLRNCSKYKEASDFRSDATYREEHKNFVGGSFDAAYNEDGINVDVNVNEEFVIDMMNFAAKHAKTIYPIYQTITGLVGMVKNAAAVIKADFFEVIKPYQPTITAVSICRYVSNDIVATFVKTTKSNGDIDVDHFGMIKYPDNMGHDLAFKNVLYGARYNVGVTEMETITDPEKIIDSKYIKERQQFYEDGLVADIYKVSLKEAKEKNFTHRVDKI